MNVSSKLSVSATKDDEEKFPKQIASEEDALAEIVCGTVARRNIAIKGMTNASLETKQVVDGRMQDKLVDQEVATRKSQEITLIQMLGRVKNLEEKIGARVGWINCRIRG